MCVDHEFDPVRGRQILFFFLGRRGSFEFVRWRVSCGAYDVAGSSSQEPFFSLLGTENVKLGIVLRSSRVLSLSLLISNR